MNEVIFFKLTLAFYILNTFLLYTYHITITQHLFITKQIVKESVVKKPAHYCGGLHIIDLAFPVEKADQSKYQSNTERP